MKMLDVVGLILWIVIGIVNFYNYKNNKPLDWDIFWGTYTVLILWFIRLITR